MKSFLSPDRVSLGLIFGLSLSNLALGDAPRNPTPAEVQRLIRERQAMVQANAVPPTLTVDTTSREAVRQFYLSVATAGETTPINWTGSFDTGVPGTTSEAFKDAVALRINAMRALAGVPALVTFNSTYSAKAQQAALMMSANHALSHTPPSSWTFYTAEGAEAAGKSNLSLGNKGVGAITYGYIADAGANNAAAGHRRWLLYPQTREMGTGDVPANENFPAANATWVFDSHFSDTRPTTRTSYVAWPAAGYMPAPLVFPRWSFSYPNANFSGASVTMTRDGATVAVQLEPLAANVGEPTLVWVYGGLDPDSTTTPTVTTDSVFHVTVSNVVINGSPQSFQYDVRVFDPARAGSDTVPVSINGPATPVVGAANAYTVIRPSFSDTLEWRSLQLDAAIPTYDAEAGLDGLTATTTGTYTPRSTATVGSGSASYQLAMPDFQNQYLTIPETFYAPTSGSPQLTFLSRLGVAAVDQVARIQVSTNDGESWSDIYSQAGAGANTESSFNARTISLSSVAGLTFRVRFAYTFDQGSAFPQTTSGIGWFLDNITLTGVQRVATTSSISTTSSTGFDFSPSAAGEIGLQARGLLFGTYSMSWGPLLVVNSTYPDPGTAPSSLVNIATRAYSSTGNNVTIGGFVISGGASKRVFIRAVGPTLTSQGINSSEVMIDPTIEVHDASHNNDIIATNDNWGDNSSPSAITATASQVGATPLLGSDTKSSALILTLAPGVYSFVVKGKNDTSGIVLLEVYDADTVSNGSTFVNIATRAYATTGNGVTIGGFVISGGSAKMVLLRGVGPTLTMQGIGVNEVLSDPTIELHDASHGNVIIATNDNWGDAPNSAAIASTGARIGATPFGASDSKSSALLLSLEPGVYSFVASGKASTSGIVLVEIYDAD